jgi:uncharacterized LabA/DUF88 family protein
MKKRVIAFIDGFNVYHSVAELGPDSNHLKWLDLNSLVRALIHPNQDELAGIEYFSAEAHWNPSDKKKRHSDYIAALELRGVNTHIGAFKSVRRTCKRCNKSYMAHEENGTDVAIAAAMVKFAHEDKFDKALLFSADSDLVPIIQSIKVSHPDKEIWIVTTPSRIRNAKELREKSSGYISIGPNNFKLNLLPAIVSGSDSAVFRPRHYDVPNDRTL